MTFRRQIEMYLKARIALEKAQEQLAEANALLDEAREAIRVAEPENGTYCLRAWNDARATHVNYSVQVYNKGGSVSITPMQDL